MLVRTLFRPGSHRSGETHPLRMLLTPCAASVRFHVARCYFLGWSATLRNPRDMTFEIDRPPGEAHEVPGPYAVRRPHARIIDVHLAAAHGIGGEGAGFEQADPEEPAVDARSARAASRSLGVIGLVVPAHALTAPAGRP